MPEDKMEKIEKVEVKKNSNHCDHTMTLYCHVDNPDCGDAIRHAQHLLNVDENGEFDKTMLGAIVNFQASKEMVATGELDAATLDALHADHKHCTCE